MAETSKPMVQLHDQLRILLQSARSETCQVIATFIDIRGFSTFSTRGDSFDIATYLSTVYTKILASYFPDADFFKPTGDGLLIITNLPEDRQKVPQAVSSVLGRCVTLVEDFSQITADDYMINFPVPQYLGAGIARGTATRLVSGGIVLDYTGKCLNLAARLMDKARPYGVVFSDERASMIIEPDVSASFSQDAVYIRGIAEEEPIRVNVTSGVKIRDTDREPLAQSGRIWGAPQTLSLAKVREASTYGFHLPRKPRSTEVASVHVEYPTFDKNGRRENTVRTLEMSGAIKEHPDGPVIYISLKRVQDAMNGTPESSMKSFLGISIERHTSVVFTSFLDPVKSRKQVPRK